jgi:hypothetical protein
MRVGLIAAGIGVLLIAWGLVDWWRLKRMPAQSAFQRYLEESRTRLLKLNRWQVQVTPCGGNPLTPEELARMAASAFGQPFVVREGDLDAIDAAFLPDETDGAQVAGEGPHFYVALAPNLFEVLDLDLSNGRTRTFEYTPSAGNIEELENGFRWTGKLAAESIDHGPVSVKLSGDRFPPIDAEKAIAALRAADPLAAFRSLAKAEE